MGENQFAAWPVALYGVDLLFAAVAYFLLTRALLGRDFKGKVSLLFYAVAVPLSFVNSWFALALYVLVAVIWLVPDPRIEKTLAQ